MTKKAAGRVILGLSAVALAAFWFIGRKSLDWDAGSNAGRPTSNQQSAPLSGSDSTNPFLALETRRQRWDQTVWANERLAQEHEAVFIRLWDALRNQADPHATLKAFAFGELRIGTLGPPARMEHNIAVRRFADPILRWSPDRWAQFLDGLKEEGFHLEQSEWRHARFAVSPRGVRESTFAVILHVFDSKKEERHVARGDLHVQWKPPADAAADPVPESMDAGRLEVLSRSGLTPFHHVLAEDLAPTHAATKTLEPSLHLHDLDGDGLSEIIFAARNRLFWNRGRGTFAQDQFLTYPPTELGAGLLADFDGDSVADFLAADAHGLALFAGDRTGRFPKPPKRIRISDQPLPNPIVMTAGDIDGDGDLDVWLAQYKVPYQNGQVPTPYYDAHDGYPSFLLFNDGRGSFQDQTEASGLATKRFRRTYSSSFVDWDDDGDLDLVVVSDFAGTDLYSNDGRGRFTDVTAAQLEEAHGFGMAHTFGDFDLDARLDLFVIGMNSFVANRLDSLQAGVPEFPEHTRMRPKMAYGNRLYFRRDGIFRQTPQSDQVARSGWSWGVAAGDFDNDGDLDLYVANGHRSGPSAKDYETQFWEHDIYAGSSKEDPILDQFFRSVRMEAQAAGHSYGGHEKNRFYLNQNGKSFLEAGYLMGVALPEDCRNVVSDDLDGDGKLDLLVTTFEVWPRMRQSLHLFPNFFPSRGNWMGVRLRESGPGFSPVGAQVILITPRGKQIRRLVTGDSYRSQHATTAHFGLGDESEITSVEIVWPNRQRKMVLRPAINRYHSIIPDAGGSR